MEHIKLFNCLKVFGNDSLHFLLRGFVSSLFLLNPNHSTCVHANLHLSNQIARFSLSNFVRTACYFCRCNTTDHFVTINISSNYA